MPGAFVRAYVSNSSLSLTTVLWGEGIAMHILRERKLRLREREQIAPAELAGYKKNWNPGLGSLALKHLLRHHYVKKIPKKNLCKLFYGTR